MKHRLYDPDNPIKWRDLPIEELFNKIEGRIGFHINKEYRGSRMDVTYGKAPAEGQTSIPGLLVEDLRQELHIAVWRRICANNRLPQDLIHFDFRFLKYVDTLLRRTLIDLHKARTFTDRKDLEPHPRKKGELRPKRKYRDSLNHSISLPEDAEEFSEMIQYY